MMEDMYTRVKRVRRQVKRDMYGMPVNEDDDKNTEEEETASSSSSSSSGEWEDLFEFGLHCQITNILQFISSILLLLIYTVTNFYSLILLTL